MPRGDGTGPGGLGPMTGRAAGFCAGYSVPGYMNPGFGFGFGWRGRGGGRGRRNRFFATGLTGWQRNAYAWPAYAPPAPVYPPFQGTTPVNPQTRDQEIDALKGQAEYFQDALDGINKRIAELEKQSDA
ncbi:MAG: DUF5320 domain-containing protein [Candidatus Omnitrophica bacterium]|nr:DUF5320 domain-containing protein [Candidatus Omnitrophota bacterium]